MITTVDALEIKSPSGFLVIDGVNGAGKTTLQKNIAAYLKNKGLQVVTSREPGATLLGQNLRKLLLEHSAEPPGALSEMLMFAADRADHVARVIRPALQKGIKVIVDRYYYSSIAFQGYGRELGAELVRKINELAIDGVYPDLVILMDLDPLEGLRRNTAGRPTDQDRMEQEDLDFHKRLRQGFLEMAQTLREPFIKVDASQSQEQIFAALRPALDKVFR
jgi:dTMP kinase